MKGISPILGNEVKLKKGPSSKIAKMSAKNEEKKMAKMNTKNEEDKMAAVPRARYNLRRRSQSGKVERKEMKLPHPRNPKTNWSVIREKMKVQRIMGINSLTLIERIRER